MYKSMAAAECNNREQAATTTTTNVFKSKARAINFKSIRSHGSSYTFYIWNIILYVWQRTNTYSRVAMSLFFYFFVLCFIIFIHKCMYVRIRVYLVLPFVRSNILFYFIQVGRLLYCVYDAIECIHVHATPPVSNKTLAET